MKGFLQLFHFLSLCVSTSTEIIHFVVTTEVHFILENEQVFCWWRIIENEIFEGKKNSPVDLGFKIKTNKQNIVLEYAFNSYLLILNCRFVTKLCLLVWEKTNKQTHKWKLKQPNTENKQNHTHKTPVLTWLPGCTSTSECSVSIKLFLLS